jgi:hypothetical protein
VGFYLRKSVRVGPLRFNLSTSGIGVSAGIRGLRVGTGPRGNYVHVGAHGIYYRATLPAISATAPHVHQPSLPTPVPQPALPQQSVVTDGLTEIESGSVTSMADSSSGDLLEEIRAKARLTTWWPVAMVTLCFASCVVVLAAPWWMSAVTVLAGIGVVVWIRQRDTLRKTVVLLYELDSTLEGAYQGFHNGFDWLAACGRVWHLDAAGGNTDWKRQAGATTIVRRSAIAPVKQAPPRLATNLAVPSLNAGRQTLYFFPERVIVYDGGNVGAIAYKDLQVDVSATNFIESASVPSDSKVVDHTWQYVNKKGGPDRRFKDNRQLPVALYGEMHLRSASGLNERFQTSNVEAPKMFADGVRALAGSLKMIPAHARGDERQRFESAGLAAYRDALIEYVTLARTAPDTAPPSALLEEIRTRYSIPAETITSEHAKAYGDLHDMIVADRRTTDSEREALKRVATALGVPPPPE